MDPNTQYDINNMIGFTTVGLLIKLFFGTTTSDDGSSGPASASIWGYGVVALSILSILFITVALATKIIDINKYDVLTSLKLLLTKSTPALLTLIVLIWLIVVNVIYFKRINQGRVAGEYYNYSSITTLIVVFQLIALFKYLKDNMSSLTSAETKMPVDRMAYVIYFLTVLNFIFTGIMTIILEFFSTDG